MSSVICRRSLFLSSGQCIGLTLVCKNTCFHSGEHAERLQCVKGEKQEKSSWSLEMICPHHKQLRELHCHHQSQIIQGPIGERKLSKLNTETKRHNGHASDLLHKSYTVDLLRELCQVIRSEPKFTRDLHAPSILWERNLHLCR